MLNLSLLVEYTMGEAQLKTGKAKTLKQTNEMLRSGDFGELVLDFNISTDEFFALADKWGDKGAKIKKEDDRFLIKLAK